VPCVGCRWSGVRFTVQYNRYVNISVKGEKQSEGNEVRLRVGMHAAAATIASSPRIIKVLWSSRCKVKGLKYREYLPYSEQQTPAMDLAVRAGSNREQDF